MNVTELGIVKGLDGRDYHKYLGETFRDVELIFEAHIIGTKIRSKVIGTIIYTSEEIKT